MIFSAKKRRPGFYYARFNHRQFIQFMRISLFTLLFSLTISGVLIASGVRGQGMAEQKVTLTLHHESLETAIKKIEAQTSLHFYYRQSDIHSFSNLNVAAGTYSVEEVLGTLLSDTFITFRQEGNYIFIERTQQESYSVAGRVTDENRQPVAFATVRLLQADRPVQTVQTDTAGRFRLTASAKGEYVLRISSVGMDSLSVAVTLGDKQTVILPDLVLSASAKQLKQVN